MQYHRYALKCPLFGLYWLQIALMYVYTFEALKRLI